MGFFDKLKAANGMSLGKVESPDFPCCSIIIKNGTPVIIDAAMNGNVEDYYIEEENVAEFSILAGGGTWVKYYIEFVDGKSAVVTQTVQDEIRERGSHIKMSPLERYIRIKRRDIPAQTTSQVSNTTNNDKKHEIQQYDEREETNFAAPETKHEIELAKKGEKVVLIVDHHADGVFLKSGNTGVVSDIIQTNDGRRLVVTIFNREIKLKDSEVVVVN